MQKEPKRCEILSDTIVVAVFCSICPQEWNSVIQKLEVLGV